MNEMIVSELNSYIDESVALCKRRNCELLEDERSDEAVFEKVKANVYDIVRTILNVAVKTGGGEPGTVQQFFVQKLDRIASDWAASYNKAKLHGDAEKVHLEQIKLDTVREIKSQFAAIWEGKA